MGIEGRSGGVDCILHLSLSRDVEEDPGGVTRVPVSRRHRYRRVESRICENGRSGRSRTDRGRWKCREGIG